MDKPLSKQAWLKEAADGDTSESYVVWARIKAKNLKDVEITLSGNLLFEEVPMDWFSLNFHPRPSYDEVCQLYKLRYIFMESLGYEGKSHVY